MAKKEEFDKITTPLGRLSFPSIFEKTAAPGSDKLKWSTVFLIPKSTDVQPIRDLMKRAVLKKWPNGVIPKNTDGSPFNNALKDGDTKDYEGYKDHHFFTASTVNKAPGVIDDQRKVIIDRSEIYAGCYAYLSINAYAWSHMGKNGVSIGLQHVMKWKDGTPFASGSSAESDFADLPLPEENTEMSKPLEDKRPPSDLDSMFGEEPDEVGGDLSILD